MKLKFKKSIEKLIISLSLFFCFIFSLSAQTYQTSSQFVVPDGYELVDSIVYRPTAQYDTVLVNQNIMTALPSKIKGDNADVVVRQSSDIANLLSQHISSNSSRVIQGYRVRIFFDNKQTSRVQSEAAMKQFSASNPGISAYRSYVNPYFKVTVGDFRTKSEAMALLKKIQKSFPRAFVVKEDINYPIVDIEHSYVVDTIKVLRPIAVE